MFAWAPDAELTSFCRSLRPKSLFLATGDFAEAARISSLSPSLPSKASASATASLTMCVLGLRYAVHHLSNACTSATLDPDGSSTKLSIPDALARFRIVFLSLSKWWSNKKHKSERFGSDGLSRCSILPAVSICPVAVLLQGDSGAVVSLESRESPPPAALAVDLHCGQLHFTAGFLRR